MNSIIAKKYDNVLFSDDVQDMLAELLSTHQIAYLVLRKILEYTYIPGYQEDVNGISKRGLINEVVLPPYLKEADSRYNGSKLSRKVCDDSINFLTGPGLIYYTESRHSREKLYQLTIRGLYLLKHMENWEMNNK